MSKTPESAVLKSVLDYLAAKHVFAMRMNTGAVRMDDKRFMRFGTPGCADVLAFPWKRSRQIRNGEFCDVRVAQPVTWIECKAPGGKQSALQKSFQAKVESEGHKYILAFSVDDLKI